MILPHDNCDILRALWSKNRGLQFKPHLQNVTLSQLTKKYIFKLLLFTKALSCLRLNQTQNEDWIPLHKIKNQYISKS